MVCAATGFAYGLDPASFPIGWVIATLGFLGASGLVAAGLWQARSSGTARVVVLIVLGVLSAGYVFANSFGLVVSSTGGPRVWPLLQWAGLALGASLYIATLLEVFSAIAESRVKRQEVSA